ncbi:MAG: hypothetical protein KGD63_04095 [Candidatus Lokiarchaeota archaeon]|nr:hypothetical protein [Candidatus Lokiarchaeota archaeon]
MKIDKWLSDPKYVENQRKRNEFFKTLSQDKKKELKEKSIKKILKKEEKVSEPPDDFLEKIIEFKQWLNNRNYLKGDKDKIEVWISNLFRIKQTKAKESEIKSSHEQKEELIKAFRRIPVNLLDEKIRMAITKKLHGYERTRTDNYYLGKFKNTIHEKLNELKYYRILKNIIES